MHARRKNVVKKLRNQLNIDDQIITLSIKPAKSLYRIGDLVFRVSESSSYIQKVHSMLTDLQGLNVPAILSRGESEGLYYSVESFVPGDKLDAPLTPYIHKILKFLKDIQGITPAVKFMSFNEYLECFTALLFGYDEILDFLLNNIPENCNYFAHGDFIDRNILTRSGEVYVLDWDSYIFAPKEYDLATLQFVYWNRENLIPFSENPEELMYCCLFYCLRKVVISKLQDRSDHEDYKCKLISIYNSIKS